MTMKKLPFEDTFPIKHSKFAFVMLVFGVNNFQPGGKKSGYNSTVSWSSQSYSQGSSTTLALQLRKQLKHPWK